MATSRRWKDSQSNEWKEETDWHNIVLWRSENLSNYLMKGKQVYVEGRLQTRSYEDRDGVKRYLTEIVADGVILLGGQQGASQDHPASGRGNNNGPVSQPRGTAAAASAPPADASSGITDDDIPFDSGPRGF